jgi:hypothetical protein
VLVSNDPYEISDIAGLGRRPRLDTGTLGFIAVTVNNALQAVTLLRGTQGQGLTVLAAGEVVVDADATEIPVGIDGETVMMPAPVRCTIRPMVLRVGVPRLRPGVLAAAAVPRLNWSVLRKLAFSRSDDRGAIACAAAQAASLAQGAVFQTVADTKQY